MARNPGAKLANEVRLLQKQVLAVANLNVLRSRHGRARIDQVDRIKHARAIFALIAPGPVVAAMRTRADDITIWKEAPIRRGISLLRRAHVEQAVLPQRSREVLGQNPVLRRRRAPEVIPGEPEPVAEIFLDRMPLVAILPDRDAVFGRREFDRCSMLVCRADRKRLVAARTAEARKDIGGQHRAEQIAQMLDAVDALRGTRDQDAFHKDFAALDELRRLTSPANPSTLKHLGAALQSALQAVRT